MKTIYEIYYSVDFATIYCGDVETEKEAFDEIIMLGKEFPMNHYWYEAIQVCEQ